MLVVLMAEVCSGLFYTNSKENDYPRLGRRTSLTKQEVRELRKENSLKEGKERVGDSADDAEYQRVFAEGYSIDENEESRKEPEKSLRLFLSRLLEEQEMTRGN